MREKVKMFSRLFFRQVLTLSRENVRTPGKAQGRTQGRTPWTDTKEKPLQGESQERLVWWLVVSLMLTLI